MAVEAGHPRVAPTRPRCAACGRSLARTFTFCPYWGGAVAPTLPNAAEIAGTRQASPAVVAVSGPSLQVTGLEVAALAEERSLVTVLFADLSGSTALGERLDPEDLRRILASFFSALAHPIQRFGGTIDKYIGDAIMAVFGAPVTREDDAERAVWAALAMQDAIGEL